jgi:hypothetical protein
VTCSGASDAPEGLGSIAGPGRQGLEHLDPLIKSRQTAAREIKHFSCRRHVSHRLRSLCKWHVSHKGKILAPSSTGFSPQISPRLWATVVACGPMILRLRIGVGGRRGFSCVGSRRASRGPSYPGTPPQSSGGHAWASARQTGMSAGLSSGARIFSTTTRCRPTSAGPPGTVLKLAGVYHS